MTTIRGRESCRTGFSSPDVFYKSFSHGCFAAEVSVTHHAGGDGRRITPESICSGQATRWHLPF